MGRVVTAEPVLDRRAVRRQLDPPRDRVRRKELQRLQQRCPAGGRAHRRSAATTPARHARPPGAPRRRPEASAGPPRTSAPLRRAPVPRAAAPASSISAIASSSPRPAYCSTWWARSAAGAPRSASAAAARAWAPSRQPRRCATRRPRVVRGGGERRTVAEPASSGRGRARAARPAPGARPTARARRSMSRDRPRRAPRRPPRRGAARAPSPGARRAPRPATPRRRTARQPRDLDGIVALGRHRSERPVAARPPELLEVERVAAAVAIHRGGGSGSTSARSAVACASVEGLERDPTLPMTLQAPPRGAPAPAGDGTRARGGPVHPRHGAGGLRAARSMPRRSSAGRRARRRVAGPVRGARAAPVRRGTVRYRSSATGARSALGRLA